MNWQQLGIEMRQGGQHKILCPECPKYGKRQEHSLSVNYDSGVYNCHKCGWSGSAKSSQNGQKQFLNRPIPKKQGEYKPTQLNDLSAAAIEFFRTRGIAERTIRLEGIKTANKWLGKYKAEIECIAFPFIKNNQRVNTKYRSAAKDMAQDGNAEKCFYRWDKLKGAEKIYITEGEIDALTLVECGYDKGVTSVPDGAPNPTANNLDNKFSYFTEEALSLFEECKQVILVTDNDANGKFLESELKRRIGIDKCYTVIYPEGCKDINEVLIKYGCDKVKSIIESAEACPVSGLKTFKDYENEIYNLRNGVQGEYYKTGWPHMDRHLKVKAGQLNILTGVPGSGKSEWVDALMINTIKTYNLKWAVFSPENYPPQVYFRKLAEKYCQKEFEVFNKDDLDFSIDQISDHITLIVDNDEDDVTLDYLFERIRTLVFREGIKGVIIDPWNEISHNIGAREDIYLNKMLRKIKRFIRKYDLIFWLVAHPKNPQKDKDGNYYKITAYDIAGGYAWFAKADNVFSVWRSKQDSTKPVEVDVQKIKQKTDGMLGTCYFDYIYKTGEYRSTGTSLDNIQVSNYEQNQTMNNEEW